MRSLRNPHFRRVYAQLQSICIHIWAKSSTGRVKDCQGEKGSPFCCTSKMWDSLKTCFFGGLFPLPFYCFYVTSDFWMMLLTGERYELFSRQAPLNICTEVQACHVFRKTTSRLYFSVQMWRLQLILLHFRTKPCFVMTQKLTKTVIVKMRWNKEKELVLNAVHFCFGAFW